MNSREESIEITIDDDVKIIDITSIKVTTMNNVNFCYVHLTSIRIITGGRSSINITAATSLTEILTNAWMGRQANDKSKHTRETTINGIGNSTSISSECNSDQSEEQNDISHLLEQ